MNKKLIAVAVAGALGAPGAALAQASTVQIYGTVVLNYAYLDSGNGILKTDRSTPTTATSGSRVKKAWAAVSAGGSSARTRWILPPVAQQAIAGAAATARSA